MGSIKIVILKIYLDEVNHKLGSLKGLFILWCEYHINIIFLKYAATATAAAKSLQSCPTLCDHIDGSPPGSTILGILQARILEWVAIPFFNAWK